MGGHYMPPPLQTVWFSDPSPVRVLKQVIEKYIEILIQRMRISSAQFLQDHVHLAMHDVTGVRVWNGIIWKNPVQSKSVCRWSWSSPVRFSGSEVNPVQSNPLSTDCKSFCSLCKVYKHTYSFVNFLHEYIGIDFARAAESMGFSSESTPTPESVST